MAFWRDFLDRLFPVNRELGPDPDADAVIINIPADIYYKDLAIYTATSLISNGISRSEVKTFIKGEQEKGQDYFLLNVSPNRNETSSVFWHKVINRVIRKGEALVVDAGGYLYCADSFLRSEERPVLGDIYQSVTVGNFTFDKSFDQSNSYLFRLDNIKVKFLIDGMYEQYGKVLSSAAKKIKNGNGNKYKLHIDGVKAGDDSFNKEFEEYIKKQLKSYMESDNAVYPEFDGYKLESDPNQSSGGGSASDYLNLKKDLFTSVAGVFHIPDSMMTGNITNIKDVVASFLTFGVDPYADMITEALNKRAGVDHYLAGNYYQVDTSRIMHRDAFDVAASVSNLISSGVKSIDEVREMLGDAPLNTDWSTRHFITKNFEEIERFLKSAGEGGE